MHGEPNRFIIGACHAVARMARNSYIIAHVHLEYLPVLEFKCRAATQNDHPFVILLVVPEPRRTRVIIGNNPFNSHSAAVEQRLQLLSTWLSRAIVEADFELVNFSFSIFKFPSNF